MFKHHNKLIINYLILFYSFKVNSTVPNSLILSDNAQKQKGAK